MGEDRKYEKIISERIFFREIIEEDTDEIVSLRSDREVYQYFTKPHKITRQEHLSWYLNQYLSDDDRLDFVAIAQDNSKFEGKILGVFGIKKDKKSEECVEVSYILNKEARGYGYASEALECLMGYASKKWNSKRFIAIIHKDNNASIRFIENLGYELVGKEEDFLCYGKTL